MDQDPVVTEQTESGKRLIEALAAAGFDVRVAFWAKPTEDGKWFLYLASPFVDEKGATVAYRHVFDVLRKTPDVWIDPLEVKVVRLNDSLTAAVPDARAAGRVRQRGGTCRRCVGPDIQPEA